MPGFNISWLDDKEQFIHLSIPFFLLGGAVVKNLPVNAGDASNESLIPGSGRSPGVGNGNPLTILAKIPWTEEPGGLHSMGSQRVGHN